MAITACSRTDIGPNFTEDAARMDPATFDCCFEPEKYYPTVVAKIITTLGPIIGPDFARKTYQEFEESEYPGGLTGKTDAHAAIISQLRPLDILVSNNASHTMGRLMPGRFSHALVYIGTEAELRRDGLWHLPEMAPYHDDIRAGRIILEGVSPVVHLDTPSEVFEVDRVAAFRPRLSQAEKRLAVSRMMPALGKPFNFRLGIDPTLETFTCAGLVDHAMPSLGLTVREAYGERTILPDDIASQAIRGEGLDVVTYVVGTDDGYARRSTYWMMVDIASFWGVPGAAPE